MLRPMISSNLFGCIIRHRIWPVLVVGHVGSETTTKISIAGVAVANQPVSCRSSLARQRPEILRRAAMFCRLLICRRDPEQYRLAKRASEEIDRYRQLDRLRRQQIARSLTAVGAAHHRAVVDLLDETGRHGDRRIAGIGTEARSQRISQ